MNLTKNINGIVPISHRSEKIEMAQCVFNIISLLVLRDTIHLLTQGHGAGEFPPDNLPCIPRALSLHGPGGGLYAQGMCPRAGQATTRCNINNVLI